MLQDIENPQFSSHRFINAQNGKKQEYKDIHNSVCSLTYIKEAKYRYREIDGAALFLEIILVGIFRISQIIQRDRKNLLAIVLNRSFTDIAEIVKRCVIMIVIGDC